MTNTVLILGASGKIGSHSARAFAAAGWQVRTFNRKTDDMTQAAQGCDVIVNGLNPPNYHDWATLIPQITRDVIAAARASGATVIVPGNVYVFGDTPGAWSEDTPHRPCARKGQIRAEMEKAYALSGVPTIILRAGNFIDPVAGDDIMALMVLNKVAKGRFTYAGSGDKVQPWCYLPDWARAAVALAERRGSLATYEDVPFPGHALTLDDLKARVEAMTGRTLRDARFPWFVLRLASPVWELARELREMRYLWETSHTLSSDRLDTLLPDFQPTPFDTVLREILPDAEMAGAPVPRAA
ncbi:NAD-dependent epimerase/dehydratase family protein [Maritimibacter sp. UBA3975]|uniref:NAD-dependent epimerase/dehydratase family protein n=1 Tax=Maritimibacter sp. UBA3975 TaxID=1946833 RepID=UPI000C0A396A|nr:NAD-dependent epimerase/dehydratase family protein [Maritimibacter sp. UBA3975]MAM63359.1 epimerase [Maritimibacter sp.]